MSLSNSRWSSPPARIRSPPPLNVRALEGREGLPQGGEMPNPVRRFVQCLALCAACVGLVAPSAHGQL